MNELENLNKQIRISDVISVLMTQSTNLIDIVNKNQIEVNRLKAELDKLKGEKVMEKRLTLNSEKRKSYCKCISKSL